MKAEMDAAQRVELTVDGTAFVLEPADVKLKVAKKKITVETFIPHVVEPSFGVGRILTAILEHAFYVRKDTSENRSVLKLPPSITPIKLAVLPLLAKEEQKAKALEIEHACSRRYILCKTDYTGVAIGKKYARVDEAGIPFAVTIDHQTLQDATVTLRERDSMKQIRVPQEKVLDLVLDLTSLHPTVTFEELMKTYPVVASQE